MPPMTRRIGVMGGTFDPIHLGHLITVSDVKDRLDLDVVLFVPNSRPPHKVDEPVSRLEDRLAMVKLALVGNADFQLDLTEVDRPGLSYALDTLRLIRKRHKAESAELFFIVGLDAMLELDTWHEPDALIREFRSAVMDRTLEVGYASERLSSLRERFPEIEAHAQLVPITRVDISSTDIRTRVSDGRSIRYMVPDSVREYIDDMGLYKNGG